MSDWGTEAARRSPALEREVERELDMSVFMFSEQVSVKSEEIVVRQTIPSVVCFDDLGWLSFCRPVGASLGSASAVFGSRQSLSGHFVCFSATSVPAGRVCLGLYDMTMDDGGLGRQGMIRLSLCLLADCHIPAVAPMCEIMGPGGIFGALCSCVAAISRSLCAAAVAAPPGEERRALGAVDAP